MLIMTYDVGAAQNDKADRQPVRFFFFFKTSTQIDSNAPDYILLSQGYLTQAGILHPCHVQNSSSLTDWVVQYKEKVRGIFQRILKTS